MTFVKFASIIRYYTKTTSVTFPDSEILLLANITKDDMAVKLAKEVGEDYFGLRFTRDLVADQREYELPNEVMSRIKYLEVKLDGSEWQKLDEIDLIQYQKTTDEATIRNDFAHRAPMFDMWDKSVFIYSGDAIIDVVDGLKLWAIIYPADFTDLTSSTDMSVNPTVTSHGFPRELHGNLAIGVSRKYKMNQTRPMPLSKEEQAFDEDFESKINEMKGANEDRAYTATVPYDDGSDY